MAIYTVTDELLTTPEAADYFVNADRRVMIGLRAALEILGLPLPAYAQRQPAGPKTNSASRIIAQYAADNGQRVAKTQGTPDPNRGSTTALAKALRLQAQRRQAANP